MSRDKLICHDLGDVDEASQDELLKGVIPGANDAAVPFQSGFISPNYADIEDDVDGADVKAYFLQKAAADRVEKTLGA